MKEKRRFEIKRITGAIEDQARTAMFLALKEGRDTFQTVASKIGARAAAEDELTTIVDYFRCKIEKETVWEECEKFRSQFIDRVVEEWREKKR